jgi:peptidoglycan/LPS O-acetylase OafA/YrhL
VREVSCASVTRAGMTNPGKIEGEEAQGKPPLTAQHKSSLYFPSLHGLRAISILIVIMHHTSRVGKMPVIPFLTDGQFAVNIFFVISGFLITSLLLDEERRTGAISIKDFFMRRTLRIFPAYYAMLLVYFILTLFGIIQISGSSWLTALTYTKYLNYKLDWVTAHGWSLSIEEQFYLMWPWIFRLGKRARLSFVLFFIILIPIFRMIYSMFFYDRVSWINDLTIFYRVDAITTGCLFALYQKEIVAIFQRFWVVILTVCLLGFIFARWFPDIRHTAFIKTSICGTEGTITNFCIAAMLFYSSFGPQGLWFKFLNLKVMKQIGNWSYSGYLWQQFFLNDTHFNLTYFPLNLVMLFGAVLISYYLIEKPFLRLKVKYSS